MDDLTRRQFLGRTAAAAAGAAMGRISMGVTDEKIILGKGSHKYECIHDWLTPPEGMVFGNTHGLAQDSAGRIYLCHTVNKESRIRDGVCVYTADGQFITSWGGRFDGGSHGLALRKEPEGEFLYHCDTHKREVVKTTLDGVQVWAFGTPKEPGVYDDKHAFVPTNVAFLPNGDFCVGDGYGSSYLHFYDRNGHWKKTFGGLGDEPGKVNCPHGLWLDDRFGTPVLAVADRANHRMQYFDLDGQHIKFVTDGLRLPCNFDIRGKEVVCPDLDSVVTILDEDNKVVVQLGDGHPSNLRAEPRSKFIPGKFINPHQAIYLANGDILVAEWVEVGRVTLLRRTR
ncbi:MAG: twin-arginine translocation signal domain-containing protein [Fimbriimonadaceae bacterium]|nr:twin-arginine translocation signal domain-containing protein [Fimbriimonadaceae bacterium]